MIICVSANPAIDRQLRLKSLEVGEVNRVLTVRSFAGGKAAHVAMAARALGEKKVVWIGFLGGSTGDEIRRQLEDLGIETIVVRTESPTRINAEIIEANGQITEILEPGGTVSPSEVEEFYAICRKVFAVAGKSFQAIFSGSLPPGTANDFYKSLILAAHEDGGQTIFDASGNAFLKGLEAAPNLIKPNAHEAENLLNLKIENFETARKAVKLLLNLGAKNVTLSLGAEGVIFADKNGLLMRAKPPKVNVISTVGCGDATVAGFAVGAARGYNISEKLRLAVACGTANCLADLPGQIRLEEVERLIPIIEISEERFAATDSLA